MRHSTSLEMDVDGTVIMDGAAPISLCALFVSAASRVCRVFALLTVSKMMLVIVCVGMGDDE